MLQPEARLRGSCCCLTTIPAAQVRRPGLALARLVHNDYCAAIEHGIRGASGCVLLPAAVRIAAGVLLRTRSRRRRACTAPQDVAVYLRACQYAAGVCGASTCTPHAGCDLSTDDQGRLIGRIAALFAI
jgi:hypothetical protein